MALFLLRWPFILMIVTIQLLILTWFLYAAYEIRMYPIKDFGYVIHEFDPWFNYRAAEYLGEHGLAKFFKWYDYMSWYPLGRPVGTTIYPGMQMSAVAIWEGMKYMPAATYEVSIPASLKTQLKKLRKRFTKRGWIHLPPVIDSISFPRMSINDICVTIPAWFGASQSLFGGLLTYEATRSVNALVVAVGVMAFIPANLMRSVAGVFDNEAVAVTAILSTFWLWTRSTRTPSSWPFAVFAGLSYVFMVAAWGGYIFVLNTIGLHALLLVGLGRFNSGVHKAYTIFFVVGTAGAVQIPVVGWAPLRSLEQIGPLGVFLGYQVLAFCDYQRRRSNMDSSEFVRFRIKCFGVLVVSILAISVLLVPMGYFGPLSSRIRGLFLKHMKTGNPLVDSVAEHQPASPGMYASHLNLPLDFVTFGVVVCACKRTNGCYFVALYGLIAMHFSLKMSRLVLICGPITAVMCAIWWGFVFDFILEPFLLVLGKTPPASKNGLEEKSGAEKEKEKDNVAAKAGSTKGKKGAAPAATPPKNPKKKSRGTSDHDWPLEEWDEEYRPGGMAEFKRKAKTAIYENLPDDLRDGFSEASKSFNHKGSVLPRVGLSVALIFYLTFISSVPNQTMQFFAHSNQIARGMSQPTILKFERKHDGSTIINDDPLKGYEWLATKTPEDSRVMAWWDYGYQITGIGKRTSLADGNTWNHEQIAMLGRLLSGSQKYSHSVLRHLADYVLIMTGGVNDDLGIATHFARIGNSAFPDHCGDDDPFCNKFSFYSGDKSQPTPMMKKSLVYNLYLHQRGAKAHPSLFEEVYESPRRELRIFKVLNVSQESKAWVADPANLVCDAPGSWYCVGQYPPSLKKFLATRRSFSQVEDFNAKGEKSAYTKMIEQQKQKGNLGEL